MYLSVCDGDFAFLLPEAGFTISVIVLICHNYCHVVDLLTDTSGKD